MTMTPYNTDLTRALKWMHNNAPNLQTIVKKKADWYQRYNNQFWTNWQKNVFDIRTANAFGLVVWCIILGLPLDIFDFSPITNAFAFGSQRGNYLDGGGNNSPITFVSGPVIYNGGTVVPSNQYSLNSTTDAVTFNTAPTLGAILTWTGTVQNAEGRTLIVNQQRHFGTGDGTTVSFSLIPTDSANFNETGSNFYGGGKESVALLNEIRQACQLRYVALVSNGRQQWINQMLKYIFNGGNSWDFPNKKYFYLTDSTLAQQPVTGEKIWRSDWEGNILLSSSPRTNYLPNSSIISTSSGWSASNATVSNSAGPDGTSNGSALITPSSNSASYVGISSGISVNQNTVYTVSMFIKAGTASGNFFGVYDSPLYSNPICILNISWSGGVPTVTPSISNTGYVANSLVVSSTGVSGWYRVQAQFNTGSTSSIGFRINGDSFNASGTVSAAYPQIEKSAGAGGYIPTSGGSAAVTDYSLNTSTGVVTMGVAPVSGAILTWQGTWNWATWTTPNQFGGGTGSVTSFQLTNPPGGAKPITQSFYMEYRIGAGLNLSAQFVNLLNNTSYGIMPTCAGIRYSVVQES